MTREPFYLFLFIYFSGENVWEEFLLRILTYAILAFDVWCWHRDNVNMSGQ